MLERTKKSRSVKCLVWDLDNTLWEGVLLEGDEVRLRDGVAEAIRELDRRGILQSVASKNDAAEALGKLEEFGLAAYFLHPQIHWAPKSESVKRIAGLLNLGIDSFAFIDDQEFERDEVQFTHPEIFCIDAERLPELLQMPELMPRFVTPDSRLRRRMYAADIQRNEFEGEFSGTKEQFLATLGMRFTIGRARRGDLERAEELTERTHQLNSTGYTYSYEELDRFRTSPAHRLLVSRLEDRYGSYGRIGLALIERADALWTLKLLLMSCRVMARGVGTIMLNYVMRAARDAGVTLRAEFAPTDRNRTMNVTFRFAGFREVDRRGPVRVLETDLRRVQECPPYLEVRASGL